MVRQLPLLQLMCGVPKGVPELKRTRSLTDTCALSDTTDVSYRSTALNDT